MEKDPGLGFKKLNFLLSSGNFPPETFANLLLLYCAPQHGFLDLAADVMAENPGYCSTLLTKVCRRNVWHRVVRNLAVSRSQQYTVLESIITGLSMQSLRSA